MKVFKILKIFIILFSSFLIIYLTGCVNPYKNNEKSAKPVIYLYPKVQQKVSVKLNYIGKLICTYPDYEDGWDVVAKPNGTLINIKDNKEYTYLFWEGIPKKTNWDLSKGYVVEGKNTKAFLQTKLSDIGLLPKEYNEFIVYWLPKMANNKYNLITFQNEAYEKLAKLDVNPKPDSILRVFMVYKPLSKPITINKPDIKPFNRNGFTLIEWGGTEIN